MTVYVYFPCFKPPPMPKTISTNLKIVHLCIVSLFYTSCPFYVSCSSYTSYLFYVPCPFYSSSTAFVKSSPAARASWLMSWIRT